MPEELMLRTLALVDQAGIVAAVAPSPGHLPAVDAVLQTWLDLSGWDGRSVDCESSDALEDALSEAAVVLLPDLADPETYARALAQTDACEFLLAALDAGVVIVADGPAAEAMGDQLEALEMETAATPSRSPALRWLPGAVVQTHFPDTQSPPIAFKRKELFRIGLPEGVAIAMGPAEEREIWGEGKPTITFREWWNA
jgi:hypothetical protein